MKEISVKYVEKLSDGSDCEFTFSIATKGIDWKTEETLHLLAQLSKSAYIQLGNKMVYGTSDQKEICRLAEKQTQPAHILNMND